MSSTPETRFTTELRRLADPIWQAQLAHPFVRGIVEGTLDAERFRHFIRQDYLYLAEYARALALASARAPTLELESRLALICHETLESEMALHRSYAEEWGISRQELEQEAVAPTTRAYTDFLLRSAAISDFAELIAALTPCMWGYSEIGQALAIEPKPADDRFARWIETYASPEFAQLADWCRELCDQAAEANPGARPRMREAFLACSRYELAFWEMGWTLER